MKQQNLALFKQTSVQDKGWIKYASCIYYVTMAITYLSDIFCCHFPFVFHTNISGQTLNYWVFKASLMVLIARCCCRSHANKCTKRQIESASTLQNANWQVLLSITLFSHRTRQTNKQSNAPQNITFFAKEVIKLACIAGIQQQWTLWPQTVSAKTNPIILICACPTQMR